LIQTRGGPPHRSHPGELVASISNPAPTLHLPIQAVIFDLDGTLYDQRKLRCLMALEMLGQILRHPATIADFRVLLDFTCCFLTGRNYMFRLRLNIKIRW